jgi:secondary thiamine-phosphate synthase enzyme
MALHTGLLSLDTEGESHVVDLTEGVRRVVAASGAEHGLAAVFVGGSTAAITTMEFEPGGVHDLRALMERLVPRAAPEGGEYAHNALNRDDNAHAHLRASLLGPSLTVPVVRGELALGTWQQIVLVDFDDRPRHRDVHVQIVA